MANGFGLTAEREGLGLAPQTAQTAPPETPRETDTTAAAEAVKPRRKSAIPSFKDNPLGAIGLVLTEIARGAKGQPSAIPELERKALAQEALNLRQTGVMLKATEAGLKMLKNVPPDQHEGAIAAFEQTIGLPGVGDLLNAMKGRNDTSAILGWLNTNFSGAAFVADMVRSGTWTAKDGADFIGGILKKGEEAKIAAEGKAPINVKIAGGGTKSFFLGSPELKEAIEAGGVVQKTPAATINLPGTETEFNKSLGKLIGDQIGEVVNIGRLAVDIEPLFAQMSKLLSEGARTGAFQPLITGLQAFAQDAGIDVTGIAKKLQIDLANVSDAQEFSRLSSAVVIESFQKFKGNLNQREVEIAEGAFANLGRTPEANIEAIAAAIASARIARQRASEALNFDDRKKAQKFLQKTILSSNVEDFLALKDTIAADIRAQRPETTPGAGPKTETKTKAGLPPGVPEGSKKLEKQFDGKDIYETPDGRLLVVE